jgi:16S rRNA (cytosine1402-N4)-methyltransferase
MNGTLFHRPIMVREVIEALKCGPNKNFVDATVGGGGHAFEILKLNAPKGMLLGIDLDGDAIRSARLKLGIFGERVILVKGNYRDMKEIVTQFSWKEIDGILFDLGASYDQLTSPTRGFSFQHPSILDMRYDQEAPLRAYDIVNRFPENELRKIISLYGEERWARRIARRICELRSKRPIETTTELAEIVIRAIPPKYRSRRIHPATRTFQAIRIVTNEELKNITIAVNEAIELLNPGGRIAIISYHSIEDRAIKKAFRSREDRPGSPESHLKEGMGGKVRIITKRPIRPSLEEIRSNPSARSAKLRVAERI